MGVLVLPVAVPSVVMVVMVAATPQAECTVKQHVMIDTGIVTVGKMYAVVCSVVCMVA